MPRIVLKPKSPEYADAEQKNEVRHCDMPGCPEHGSHKAPKHRGLNEYYLFCIEHTREYNSAWDFFSGMSQHEVENHINSSLYGDRPTWQYAGVDSAINALHNAAWKTHQFSDEDRPRTQTEFKVDSQTPEFQAMAIMGLKPPVTMDEIKSRYKALVKKHHPDVNQGSPQSEELLKQVNMAYTILKLAFDAYKRLPEHKF